MKKNKSDRKAETPARKPAGVESPAGDTFDSIEELRAVAAKYRFLTEQMDDIVWTTDLGMRTTYVSPSIEKVLGFTPAERMKQPLEEQAPPATLRLAGEKLAEELALDGERDPGRSIIIDLDYYHQDGSIRTLETRLSFLRDEEGKPFGIYGLSRDITDRKRAEDDLRRSEARFRAVFDQAKDGIFIETPEGRILDVNRAVTGMLGYSREELLKMRVGDLVPPEVAARLSPTIRPETLAEGAYVETEEVAKDGTRIPVEVGNTLVEIGGEKRVIAIVRDISERKRAEEALAEEAIRRRILVEQSPDGIVILDQAGGVWETNQRFAEMLGYTPEELGDLHVWDWDCQLPREQILEMIRTVDEEGDYFETRHRRKDGTFYDAEISTNGAVIGGRKLVFCVCRDITDRKRAEEALKRSEARFKNILLHAPLAIQGYRTDGTVVYWNREAERVYGYTAGEAVGGNLGDLIIPDELLPLFRQGLEICAGLEKSGEFMPAGEVSLRRKDGSRVFVHSIHTAVCVEGEEPMLFCLDLDLAQRKRMEDELRDFKTAVEQSVEGIAITDLEGKIRFANQAWADMHGYQVEEMIGRHLEIFHNREQLESEVIPFNTMLLESGYNEGEVDHLRRDGSVFPAWMSATLVRDGENKPIGMLGMMRDITDRKRAEAERQKMERKLQQTQKLESLGVLAGGIAHDFNNILMVILGNAELALREMGSLSPARESVTEITAASRQAAELCKQMLAYAGRASFVREPLDLATLIKETAHLIKVSTSRGVVLKYELEPGLVEGDPSQLRQVVMNLVINSSESIGERSGVVTIATGKVFLDEAEARRRDPSGGLKAGEYVCLRVADNGRGMDEETRSRVFEPFFTTKFTGRGLGLAAVLGIVQGHGGTISAESEPEVGTTFQVLLPALGAKQSARPAVSGKGRYPAWTGTGTVLVAEDEERVRTLAVRILEDMGFAVLAAADGREAVEVYREHGKEIDLVILDLTMPHLDGAGALEKILEIDPEARIILASGFSEEELERRFRQSGLAGILQKPYDLDSFAAAVRRALTR